MTKKPKARTACYNLLKERNVISMVIQSPCSVDSLERFPGSTYRRVVSSERPNTRRTPNVRKIENPTNGA